MAMSPTILMDQVIFMPYFDEIKEESNNEIVGQEGEANLVQTIQVQDLQPEIDPFGSIQGFDTVLHFVKEEGGINVEDFNFDTMTELDEPDDERDEDFRLEDHEQNLESDQDDLDEDFMNTPVRSSGNRRGRGRPPKYLNSRDRLSLRQKVEKKPKKWTRASGTRRRSIKEAAVNKAFTNEIYTGPHEHPSHEYMYEFAMNFYNDPAIDSFSGLNLYRQDLSQFPFIGMVVEKPESEVEEVEDTEQNP